MPRALLVLAALLAPSLVLAFHDGLSCGDCHVPSLGSAGGPGPVRGGDETRLCLGCHDGRFDAPSVMGAGRPGEPARLAGGLSRAGDGPGRGGYGEDTAHTLGSREPPPGFPGAWTGPLGCKSCHAVHPNGRYRNLGPDPLIRDPAYRALVDRAWGAAALPAAGAAPDAVPGALDRFCAGCHPLFHGPENTQPRGSWGPFVRHPTGGVAPSVDVRGALALAAETPRLSFGPDGAVEVACVTCHRAHGSRHAFALVWFDRGARSNGEDGAGTRVESLCLTCHRVDDDRPRAVLGGGGSHAAWERAAGRR